MYAETASVSLHVIYPSSLALSLSLSLSCSVFCVSCCLSLVCLVSPVWSFLCLLSSVGLVLPCVCACVCVCAMDACMRVRSCV